MLIIIMCFMRCKAQEKSPTGEQPQDKSQTSHPIDISTPCPINKASAQAFAQGLLSGQILAPPGVNMPAIPLPVLQDMVNKLMAYRL